MIPESVFNQADRAGSAIPSGGACRPGGGAPARVAVTTGGEGLLAAAAFLAGELGLPLLDPNGPGLPVAPELLLRLTPERLELDWFDEGRREGAVFVDFTAKGLLFRLRQEGWRREPVARAVGMRHGIRPRVLDATAGLGRDAVVLARLGCRVHMLERSPVVAALLADGLRRGLAAGGEIAATVGRLGLTPGDASRFMTHTDFLPTEVVYLDPMYPEPERKRSALAGKEMRTLRLLVGDDADADAILARAMTWATERVVVKRPRKAPPLGGRRPDHTIPGGNTRFDVYRTTPFPVGLPPTVVEPER
ncbi:MAG: class I SAM-dependent methyltransferase [Magnetococcales bacterium]|nr:class I SAM-dependent methyltransferase [Magnetococcales bacterium]MBF0155996.1 class I SAM-dependent methyltransferase [Magnetococcales bacterium]